MKSMLMLHSNDGLTVKCRCGWSVKGDDAIRVYRTGAKHRAKHQQEHNRKEDSDE